MRSQLSQQNAEPGSDDAFARFELRNGIRRVRFTVAAEALEALSGLAAPSTPAQRRQSFDRFRIPINIVAQRKVDALAAMQSGTRTDSIRLTVNDLAGVLGAIAIERAGKVRSLPRHVAVQLSSAG